MPAQGVPRQRRPSDCLPSPGMCHTRRIPQFSTILVIVVFISSARAMCPAPSAPISFVISSLRQMPALPCYVLPTAKIYHRDRGVHLQCVRNELCAIRANLVGCHFLSPTAPRSYHPQARLMVLIVEFISNARARCSAPLAPNLLARHTASPLPSPIARSANHSQDMPISVIVTFCSSARAMRSAPTAPILLHTAHAHPGKALHLLLIMQTDLRDRGALLQCLRDILCSIVANLIV